MGSARVTFALAAVLCVVGCTKESAEPAAPAASAPASDPLVGIVAERLEAPGYTYLRLTRTPMADVWVAVPTATTAVGAKVRINDPSPMENFESKTLGRTFPLVLFSSGVSEVGAQPVAAAPPVPVAAPSADVKERRRQAPTRAPWRRSTPSASRSRVSPCRSARRW